MHAPEVIPSEQVKQTATMTGFNILAVHPNKPNSWTKLTVLELTVVLLFFPGLWIVVGVLSQYLPFLLACVIYSAAFLLWCRVV